MSTVTLPEAGAWVIDPTHTTVAFSARHLMAAKVRGSFRTFSGEIDVNEDHQASAVSVTIDAASIDTGVEDRDDHLRSPDFLDVENFPTINFKSTAVRQSDDGFEIEGDLTIRGTSKPVTLSTEYFGVIADPWGNEKALFSANTDIDREEFGLTWNAPLEAGGWLVGKKVNIEIEIQAAKA
ncbi:MAG: YceI family protein [Acidimicrobiia bacterium]|nr:YceI family protein [Acidimicrobiia bacterium]